MNNYIKILLFFCIFSKVLSALLTEKAINNINNNQNNILKTIEFDYTEEQKRLIVDNYVKIQHDDFKNDNLEEVKNKILELMNKPFKDKIKMDNIFVEEKEIPLKINKNKILIDGISSKNQEKNFRKNHCLVVSINEEYLHVNGIASVYTACPIPAENSGTFLLKVVDYIAKKYQKNKIILMDASTIKCQKNSSENDLLMLSIFKNGLSFYGKRGYYSKTNKSIAKDLEEGNAIRNISLEDLIEKIASLDFSILQDSQKKIAKTKNILSYIKTNFIEKVNMFKTTGKSKNLGEFFIWLWNFDCESYDDIFSLVFNSDINITSPLYPDINLTREMIRDI